jgi:TRAP-type C4-dicarboxylate transport system permease small subunit
MRNIFASAAVWTSALFRHVSALMLFMLMVLTCIDVLGRYFFNHPVYGGLELTEILLAGMIFFTLPLVSYRSQHVVVDLFNLPSRRLQTIQHFVTNVISAAATSVLSHQLWLRAERLERAGETTIQIKIPMDLIAYSISVLMALTAVAFVIRAFVPNIDVETTGEI